MKVKSLHLHSYEIPLTSGHMRSGVYVKVINELGMSGFGEIAPLPKWSKETLEEAICSLNQNLSAISNIEWTSGNYLKKLAKLKLLPSASFGFESAILSLLLPLPEVSVQISALLMGSVSEILEQAKLRHAEGIVSAKLKVSNLSFKDAFYVIDELKGRFRLRIDVNRAWTTSDSLRFFSQFSLDTFDYVEEPFQSPHDLTLFPHPLAVDESFPENLSLQQLESFSTLKALIYKPTIQGGLLRALPLYQWAKKRKIDLVISSCFESDLGLACVASVANRLSLLTPVGIGTHYFFSEHGCANSLKFHGDRAFFSCSI